MQNFWEVEIIYSSVHSRLTCYLEQGLEKMLRLIIRNPLLGYLNLNSRSKNLKII